MALYRVIVLVRLLIDVYGDVEKHYVKKNETVTLLCPYGYGHDKIAWRKSAMVIAYGGNILIRSDTFSIIENNYTGEQNLRIVNFAEEKIGQYACDSAKDEAALSHVFELILCNVPHDINLYDLQPLDSSDVNVKNTYCKIKSNEKPNISCVIVNNKQCLTADKEFQIHLLWNETSKHNEFHDNHTNYGVMAVACECGTLKETQNSPTEFLEGFYNAQTLYLKNISTLDIRQCHCGVVSDRNHRDDVYSAKASDHTGLFVVFVVSFPALCIIICIGIYMQIRKATKSPARRICQNWNHSPAININNSVEPRGNAQEGYSSIDRRLNLESGLQQVSYLSYSESGHQSPNNASTNSNSNIDDPARHTELQQCFKIKIAPTLQQEQPLNYIDIMFDSRQRATKFYIRGDSKRTQYAEIDLAVQADPLPDSDSSEDDDEDSDNDFMSLSGIQNWTLHT